MENVMKVNNWDDVRKIIDDTNYESPSWPSDQESLREIIFAAEKLGIPAPNAESFSLSKFRSIIKQARLIARRREKNALEKIIKQSQDLSYRELKLELGITTPEEILINKIEKDGDIYYNLKIRPDQLKRFQASLKIYYTFVEKG